MSRDYSCFACLAEAAQTKARAQAYELVDWLRLVDEPLGIAGMQRLVNVISRLNGQASFEVFEYISPKSNQLWSNFESLGGYMRISK